MTETEGFKIEKTLKKTRFFSDYLGFLDHEGREMPVFARVFDRSETGSLNIAKLKSLFQVVCGINCGNLAKIVDVKESGNELIIVQERFDGAELGLYRGARAKTR